MYGDPHVTREHCMYPYNLNSMVYMLLQPNYLSMKDYKQGVVIHTLIQNTNVFSTQ